MPRRTVGVTDHLFPSTDDEARMFREMDTELREDVDARRIAILGRSFGGYWSAKMSFVEPERLRAAVVWGGGVHYNFQPDWVRHSTNAESYLMDHEICRASAFGLRNLDELAAFFPSLSLKTQGLLDKPSCPTLVVNGKNDLQTPIDDLYLLLEHAAPRPPGCFPEATWDRRRRPSPPLFAGSGRRWKRNLLGLQNCATRIKS